MLMICKLLPGKMLAWNLAVCIFSIRHLDHHGTEKRQFAALTSFAVENSLSMDAITDACPFSTALLSLELCMNLTTGVELDELPVFYQILELVLARAIRGLTLLDSTNVWPDITEANVSARLMSLLSGGLEPLA